MFYKCESARTSAKIETWSLFGLNDHRSVADTAFSFPVWQPDFFVDTFFEMGDFRTTEALMTFSSTTVFCSSSELPWFFFVTGAVSFDLVTLSLPSLLDLLFVEFALCAESFGNGASPTMASLRSTRPRCFRMVRRPRRLRRSSSWPLLAVDATRVFACCCCCCWSAGRLALLVFDALAAPVFWLWIVGDLVDCFFQSVC